MTGRWVRQPGSTETEHWQWFVTAADYWERLRREYSGLQIEVGHGFDRRTAEWLLGKRAADLLRRDDRPFNTPKHGRTCPSCLGIGIVAGELVNGEAFVAPSSMAESWRPPETKHVDREDAA